MKITLKYEVEEVSVYHMEVEADEVTAKRLVKLAKANDWKSINEYVLDGKVNLLDLANTEPSTRITYLSSDEKKEVLH